MPDAIAELGLSRDDQIQVEMAMQRRQDHVRREAEVPQLTSAASLVHTVLSRIQPLPEGLARRWDGANLSLRNARRDVKRNPGSVLHEENLRMMERQAIRVWTEVCAHKALNEIQRRSAA